MTWMDHMDEKLASDEDDEGWESCKLAEERRRRGGCAGSIPYKGRNGDSLDLGRAWSWRKILCIVREAFDLEDPGCNCCSRPALCFLWGSCMQGQPEWNSCRIKTGSHCCGVLGADKASPELLRKTGCAPSWGTGCLPSRQRSVGWDPLRSFCWHQRRWP